MIASKMFAVITSVKSPGRLAWLRALCLAVALLVPGLATAAPDPAQLLDEAIARALEWMHHHPATPADGGLLDMIDEGIFFLMIRDLAATSDERERYAQALRSRMERVDALPGFERWARRADKSLIEHYHLVLAAYLMRLAGRPSAFESQIVGGAKRALLAGPRAGPTVTLTVALLLDRLGAAGPWPHQVLLEQSGIGRLARGYRLPLAATADPRVAYLVSQQLYAIVHEVLALTGFGREAPRGWLAERRDGVVDVLRQGVIWARARRHVDLVAELLVCAHLMGEVSSDEFHAASLWLARTQQSDGSWGEQTTPRANKRRHATMTAAFALMIQRGELVRRASADISPGGQWLVGSVLSP